MKTHHNFSPLIFSPILVPRMWGGQRLGVPVEGMPIGEAWLLSSIPGYESRVRGGAFDGWTLRELNAKYPEQLLGDGALEGGNEAFPLLIKLIDTAMPLSVQVHPDDGQAKEMGYECGKSEMWYILESGDEAQLLIGLQQDLSPDALERAIREDRLPELLNCVRTHRHECYHIPAGQIHSIGASQFLLEIQQSSNTTFRLSDFGRTDQHGNRRQLHVAEGKRCSQLNALRLPEQLPLRPRATPLTETLVCDPHFTAFRTYLPAASRVQLKEDRTNRPVCLIPIEGNLRIRWEGSWQKLALYEPVLIARGAGAVRVQSDKGGLFLQVYSLGS